MPTEKQTDLATQKKPTTSLAKKLEAVKYREQIRRVERAGNLAALNDYIGFGVSKLLGLGGLVGGLLEMLAPSILPITLNNPELVAGVGLALLTGKSVLTLIAKMEKSSRGER